MIVSQTFRCDYPGCTAEFTGKWSLACDLRWGNRGAKGGDRCVCPEHRFISEAELGEAIEQAQRAPEAAAAVHEWFGER
jgi:hypothetical protein